MLYVVNRILDQGGRRHMGQWAMPGQCTVVLNLNPAENNGKVEKGSEMKSKSSKITSLLRFEGRFGEFWSRRIYG